MHIQSLPLVLPLALAALLTTATAKAMRNQAKRGSHATSTSQAFTLVANITDPAAAAAVFDPTIDSTWAVTAVHVGAAANAAVLGSSGAVVLWQNGTAGSSTAFVSDAGGAYPLAMDLSALESRNNPPATPPGETVYYVGINIGNGDMGLSIAPAGVAQALVAAPAAPPGGVFAVCNVTRPSYGNPQYPVRYVVGDGDGRLPPTCVEVALLAQCATLGPVPDGALYDHDSVQTVPCYESVAGIDWSASRMYCGRGDGAPVVDEGFVC